MPWNLLLLPLLGGYLFASGVRPLRFLHQKYDGHRLLLASAAYAVALAVAARIGVALLAMTSFGERLQTTLAELFRADYTGTALCAFLLGWASPLLINRFFPMDTAVEWALDEVGDEITKFLYWAANAAQPVLLTLDNRKVYVGIVLGATNLSRSEANQAVLLPLWSGYRRSEDLSIRFTTFYDELYQQVFGEDSDEDADGDPAPEDFAIILPLSRIASATYFDIGIYRRNFHPDRIVHPHS